MAIIKLTRKTTTGGTPPTAEGQISCNIFDKNIFVGDGNAGSIKFIDQTQVTSQINSAIGGLSSAFEYKGAVAGNGQASTATAVDAQELATTPAQGDYWRISTAGYVKKDGATDANAFFVNVSDAVVYNGSDWDKIDNTNSGITSADSGADIQVTGSTDAGFVIGFSSTATLDQANQVVDGGQYT